MQLLYRLSRSLLFLLSAETAHNVALRALNWVGKLRERFGTTPQRHESLAGVSVANRVGLAPGFVKHPRYRWAPVALGFGFAELGTLTRLPQSGNPKPRIFRVKPDRVLINRLGFNNPGYHEARRYLQAGSRLPVAINLGKNKRSDPAGLLNELRLGVHMFADVADWFVINLSSPNTPGLRALLEPQLLGQVLQQVAVQRRESARFYQCPVRPLFLKLHPDMEPELLEAFYRWLPEADLDGVIATNTTTSRAGLTVPDAVVDEIGAGGVSGPPLAAARDTFVQRLREVLPADKTVIAVGGIDSAVAAARCFDAGADAVELYTGLIYEGPGLIRKIATPKR